MIAAPIWRSFDCCEDEVGHATALASPGDHDETCAVAASGAEDGCGLDCLFCCACCQPTQALVPRPSEPVAELVVKLDADGLFPRPGSPDPERQLLVPKAA